LLDKYDTFNTKSGGHQDFAVTVKGGVQLKRVDERDVMFSRLGYQKESFQYEDYYARNPHKKEVDDRLRMPPMKEGNPSFEPLNTPIGDAVFRFLKDIKRFADGTKAQEQIPVESVHMTAKLKGMARYYGANLVGVARLQEDFYYSHRGREPEVYGEKIDHYHDYALVFAVEMEKDMIATAPFAPEAIEVTKGYLDAAIIGMALSYYIRELGYEARNHMDGNYLLPMPVLAQAAGLGEMGKIGLLVTKEYGPRIRLGAVTTNMPLIADQRESFNLLSFCNQCNNCALRCPSQAIPLDFADETHHGKISDDQCFAVWKRVFTDCGICLASCPFSSGQILEGVEGPYTPEFVRETVHQHNERLFASRMDPARPYPWLHDPVDDGPGEK